MATSARRSNRKAIEPAVRYRREIALWGEGKSVAMIARELGRPESSIGAIVRGHRGLFPERPPELLARVQGGSKIPAATRYAREIELWKAGKSLVEIAREVGRSVPAVAMTAFSRRTRHLFPPRPKPNSVALNQEAVRLWEQGVPVAGRDGIAEKCHTAVSYIKSMVKRFPGLFPPRARKRIQPEVTYAREIALWAEGKTIPQIAKAVGRSLTSVGSTVRKYRRFFPTRVTHTSHRTESSDRHTPLEVSADGELELPRRKAKAIGARRTRTVGKTSDPEFSWLTAIYGEDYEEWRAMARDYMGQISQAGKGGYAGRLFAVGQFLERYITSHRLANPEEIFRGRGQRRLAPLFKGGEADEEAPFTDDIKGIAQYNAAIDFLDWVLAHSDRFSFEAGNGARERRPGFANPFARRSVAGMQTRGDSVWNPLPFKVILELKKKLAPGRHFSDWLWAQNAFKRSRDGACGDWVEVDDPEIVSKIGLRPGDAGYDPDLVLRERDVPAWSRTERSIRRLNHDRHVVEMWCPVRAVALLVKLELPLRTFQTRVLDSGEADSERCDLSEPQDGGADDYLFRWSPNPRRSDMLARLAPEDARRVASTQGVFRKILESFTKRSITGFFINTNKTGDRGMDWSNRGYVVPWEYRPLLRWLLKLRNWQERYNPVDRPTLWVDLGRDHLGSAKDRELLRTFSPTCFLFRNAAARSGKFWKSRRANAHLLAERRTMPMTSDGMQNLWFLLLKDYQHDMAAAGERDAHGDEIKLVRTGRRDNGTFFPLHSLRVSLITGLAFSGRVRMEVLQKLAGHKRLLMTAYYVKLGQVRMHEELQRGAKAMADNAGSDYVSWLKQLSYDALAERTVTFDPSSLKQAICASPTERNAINWVRVDGGWCLVGANTSARAAFNRSIHGCHDGGEALLSHPTNVHGRIHEGVPPRSCAASGCRWFLTGPEYIPELKTRINIKLYHLYDLERSMIAQSEAVTALEAEKLQAERAGSLYGKHADLVAAHARYEKSEAEYASLKTEADNLIFVMERCVEVSGARRHGDEGQNALVALGSMGDVQIALSECDSALVQLTDICLDAVVYPALRSELGKAVMHRSQLFDKFAQRTFGQPVFFALDEEAQLNVGNAVTRAMMNTLRARPGYEDKPPGEVMALVAQAIEGDGPMASDLLLSFKDVVAAVPGAPAIGTPLASLISATKGLPQTTAAIPI